MAEKSSELNQEPDAISTTAGATHDSLIKRDEYDLRDSEILESRTDDDDTTDDSGEDTAEADQIRTQIEETRSNLGSTIDAIQERLSFQNISDQVKEQVSEHIESAVGTAKDAVYDATVGKVGDLMNTVNKGFKEVSKSGVMQSVGQNPLALSLIGIGIGLLVMQSRKKSPSAYRYERHDETSGENYGRSYDRAEYTGATKSQSESDRASFLKTAQDKIGDTAGSAYETVTGTASVAASSVSNAASSAVSGVSDAASTAVSTVGDYGKDAYEKVGESYEYYIEENPLAVGAVALAIGAAIGFSLPSTSYEGELMGATKQNLMQKATESAGVLVDKVKQVAGEAQKTLTEEVKSAAGEVQKTIGDQAKAQGLTGGTDKPANSSAAKSPGISPNPMPGTKPKM